MSSFLQLEQGLRTYSCLRKSLILSTGGLVSINLKLSNDAGHDLGRHCRGNTETQQRVVARADAPASCNS